MIFIGLYLIAIITKPRIRHIYLFLGILFFSTSILFLISLLDGRDIFGFAMDLDFEMREILLPYFFYLLLFPILFAPGIHLMLKYGSMPKS